MREGRNANAPRARGEAADISDGAGCAVRPHDSTAGQDCTGLARLEVRNLLDGGAPSSRDPAAFGDWRETVTALREAHDRGGTDAVRPVWNTLAKADPALYRLVSTTANRKTTWTRRELAEADFPEPDWLVPDVLPMGLACLAGRPKVGKSWLLLQMAHAVATGGMIFGRRVKRGRVLYLALEDSARRLKQRCDLQGIGATADITFELQWPALADGGLARLHAEIDGGGYRFIALDTFARLVGSADQDDVGVMTAMMGNLQELAQAGDRCLVLNDHHRKPSATGADPIDDILGSTGKAAVVDTAWGLYRHRGKREVELKIVGRDVEEAELALEFDPLTRCWQCLGKVDDVRRDTFAGKVLTAIRALAEMGEVPTVTSVARHLEADKGQVGRTTQDLLAAGRIAQGKPIGAKIPLLVVPR